MRKSKFMKALLLLGMSAITATAVAFSACGGDGNNGDNGDGKDDATGHTHTWSEYKSDATQHWKECTAEGHDGDVKGYVAVHDWDNDEDTTCNTCGYVRNVTGGGEGGGETENPPAELTQTLIKAEDLNTSLAVGDSIGNGLTIDNKATEIDTGDSVYTSYFNGEEISTASRIKLGGTINGSSGAQACIKVTATTATTLYVYAYSGGSTDRSLALYETSTPDSGSKFIEGTSQSIGNGSGTALGVAKFSIGAGETRYIGSTGSGINIYAIGVITGGTVTETVKSAVEATPATCTETGIKAHWISNYGVYYTNEGLTTVTSIPGLVTEEIPHTYVDGHCSVCGRDENAAITKIDFAKLSDGSGEAYDVDATFGTTWLKVTTKGTSKWASGSGLSTKSSVIELTVSETSTFSICYYSTSSGRTFNLNGTDYEANSAPNKTVVVELNAGTYTLTFDGNEHKVSWISLLPSAE
ncbi:MAG: hypothetical protein HDQ88_01900 [Clostridia bacterium]|nr:hypothetical protein [Clostridia bacterium]